jgi:hypothetical protein
VNVTKSQVLIPPQFRESTPCGIAQASGKFVVLGADIDNESPVFINEQLEKQETYFNLLHQSKVHPQVKMALLRICGAPRIKYLCETCPPEVVEPLVNMFDGALRCITFDILGFKHNDVTDDLRKLVHNKFGLGIPEYKPNYATLYHAAADMVTNNRPEMARMELITTDALTPYHAHQVCGHWLTYDGSLSPSTYVANLCYRLGILPGHLRVAPIYCSCNKFFGIGSDQEWCMHVMRCDKASRISHTHRHNLVRDALATTARSFGMTVSKEPTVYPYDGGVHKRPDLLFMVKPTPIVTDVTIVSAFDDEPGAAARAAEAQKTLIHATACSRLEHQFVPFAMESSGFIGQEAFLNLNLDD